MSMVGRSSGVMRSLLSLALAVTVGGAVGLQQWWHHVERRREEAAALKLDRELGVTIEPLDVDLAEDLELPPDTRGLVVTSLAEGRPAERAGLQAGDVIERIAARPIEDATAAAQALDASRAGTLEIIVNRHGRDMQVALRRG
jgi:C-terminal processing protease CtpA/Prc